MTLRFAGFAGEDERTGIEPAGTYNVDTGWANPYPPPPMVTVDQSSPPSSGGILDDLASIFRSTSAGVQAVTSLVDIHGRPVQAAPPPHQTPTTPVWIYLLIPVGLIGALIIAKKMMGPSRRLAGYRRRKSRRSRRNR